jgi:hypothetical protein
MAIVRWKYFIAVSKSKAVICYTNQCEFSNDFDMHWVNAIYHSVFTTHKWVVVITRLNILEWSR